MTGKKASIILVLKILEKYSDQENPLTQQKIIDLINNDYGVKLERKSVAASLTVLRDELEYDINKNGKGGFYLGERLFEPSEVNYLTDAIFSSKAISGNYAKDLSKKVMSVLSDNYQKNYRPPYKCDQVDRSEDKGFFMTIDFITHAIRHNRKVSFKYMTYDKNLNVVPRINKNGRDTVIVSPLYMVYSRGLCYLLSIPEHEKGEELKDFTPYRIDYIRDIREVPDSTRERATSLTKYKDGFDIAEFINNHIYIFGSDEKTKIKLLVKKPDAIRYLKEWFGKQVELKTGDEIIATVKSDEQTFFFWIMQYSEHFTLLEPKSLVKKVRAAAKNILDTYK